MSVALGFGVSEADIAIVLAMDPRKAPQKHEVGIFDMSGLMFQEQPTKWVAETARIAQYAAGFPREGAGQMEPHIHYRGYLLSVVRRNSLWRVGIYAASEDDKPPLSYRDHVVSGPVMDAVIAEAKQRIDALLED